jgi:hypothetical protein
MVKIKNDQTLKGLGMCTALDQNPRCHGLVPWNLTMVRYTFCVAGTNPITKARTSQEEGLAPAVGLNK